MLLSLRTGWRGRPAEVDVLSLGATLCAWRIGDRDLLLGPPPTEEAYLAQDKYFGALVGRVANRIAGAGFDLDGRHYELTANQGRNCLHGGVPGFHTRLWELVEKRQNAVKLQLLSPDGEAGFPGNLEVTVIYRLLEEGESLVLEMEYLAHSDRATLCSLTQHSYFNLGGHQTGHLEGHELRVLSHEVTENDADQVPTGRRLPVEGTALDYREFRSLSCELDHNFILADGSRPAPQLVAELRGHGLLLQVESTQPGMQVYTAGFLAGDAGKEGLRYGPGSAVCLECQSWPDAIHHEDFPSIVLRPGEVYRECTRYRLFQEEDQPCPPLPRKEV